MNLKDITEDDIIDFADSTIIAARGLNYYENEMVKSFRVKGKKIMAKVEGSMGKYDTKLWIENGKLDAKCNCPYEGYCCKHITAVLYKWINEKSKTKNEVLENHETIDLKKELSKTEKRKLEELLCKIAEENEGIKADIINAIAKPGSNENLTVKKIIKRQIKEILSEGDYDYYEVHGLVRELEELKKRILKCPPKTRSELLKEIIEKVVKAGEDSDDSDASISTFVQISLEELGKAFGEQNLSFEEKKKIILENLSRYEKDDYGFEEGRLELAINVPKSKDEYDFLIEELKKKISKKKNKYESSAYEEALTEIYKKSGMEKEYLEMLEKNAKENKDFLPLARFWKEKNQIDKAVQIAEKGIKQEPKTLWHDSELYDFLEEIYLSQKNKKDLLRIMILHFEQNPSLKKYRKILAVLGKHKNKNKIKENLISKVKDDELIDILLFENMLEKAFEEIMKLDGNYFDKTKSKVAKALKKNYPEKSLKIYKSLVNEFIDMAKRDSYITAFLYAKKIKELLHEMNKTEEWKKYLEEIRESNRRRPALIEEFSRL